METRPRIKRLLCNIVCCHVCLPRNPIHQHLPIPSYHALYLLNHKCIRSDAVYGLPLSTLHGCSPASLKKKIRTLGFCLLPLNKHSPW
ncbi:hypothetical protein K1719_039271 [Acacia pycnantha]|nr:hypothetical protein K1719_039271 [Acacia pycnantha]